MKRREFLFALGGGAIAWPLTARAQQAGKLPTIGYLDTGNPTSAEDSTSTFVRRLRGLGWNEGRTIAIEYRWAEGRKERYAELAAEFVRMKVDVIVTTGNAVPAVKQATTTIPIVFGVAADPVGQGLVASLARPGGNVTGLSLQSPDLAGKRLELLRQVVPDAGRVAVMYNSGYAASVSEANDARAAAAKLGFEAITSEIPRAEDIAPAFQALQGRAGALYVCSDAIVNVNRKQISSLALAARLPSASGWAGYPEAGGLMSYGPDFLDLYRHAAEMVDKILRGAKPADIPVQQPSKFDLIFNLATAKALNIVVSPGLISSAATVFE